MNKILTVRPTATKRSESFMTSKCVRLFFSCLWHMNGKFSFLFEQTPPFMLGVFCFTPPHQNIPFFQLVNDRLAGVVRLCAQLCMIIVAKVSGVTFNENSCEMDSSIQTKMLRWSTFVTERTKSYRHLRRLRNYLNESFFSAHSCLSFRSVQ